MLRFHRRLATGSLATIAAAGLLLTGCTSSDSQDSSTQPVASESASPTLTGAAAQIQQAADNTAAAGSAKVAGTVSNAGMSGGDQTVKFEGAYNFSEQSLQMEMTGGLFNETDKIEVIVIGTTTYVRMPGIPGAGDSWIKTDTGEMTNTDVDPTQALEDLKNLGDLKEAGTETLDGVQTTKYTGTMNLDDALASAGVTESAAPADAKAEMTVWVDDEQRIRQIKTMTKVAGVSSDATFRFYDFGVDTDIQAPPADQVIDSSQLTQNLPGGEPIPTP